MDPGFFADTDPNFENPDADPDFENPDADPDFENPDPDPDFENPDPDPDFENPDPDPFVLCFKFLNFTSISATALGNECKHSPINHYINENYHVYLNY